MEYHCNRLISLREIIDHQGSSNKVGVNPQHTKENVVIEELEARLGELREALESSNNAAEQYQIAQQLVETEMRLSRIDR
jgi:hypothetical protein